VRGFLIVVGLILGALGLWNWFDIDEPNPSTVKEVSRQEMVTETSEPSVTKEESKAEEREVATDNGATSTTKTTTTTPGEKSTVTGPTNKRTITTAAPGTRRSEGVTLALLGFGFACLLAGTFHDRISAIKFPGGEVTLSDATEDLKTAVSELKKSQTELKAAVATLARKLAR
jgi:hypothetical protein